MYSLPAWAYQIVPLNAEVPHSMTAISEIQIKKSNQPLGRLDCTSIVLDIVMEKAEEEKEIAKEVPVKHFYIDFRFMLLKRKIQDTINDQLDSSKNY